MCLTFNVTFSLNKLLLFCHHVFSCFPPFSYVRLSRSSSISWNCLHDLETQNHITFCLTLTPIKNLQESRSSKPKVCQFVSISFLLSYTKHSRSFCCSFVQTADMKYIRSDFRHETHDRRGRLSRCRRRDVCNLICAVWPHCVFF